MIEALAREIAQTRQEGSETVPERPPLGEGQSNGIIERAAELVGRPGKNAESCTGTPHRSQSPARRKDIVLAGGIRFISDERMRRRQ